MGALSLAANQFALATTVYGSASVDSNGALVGLQHPGILIDATGQRVEHQLALATTWPRKELGPVPPTCSGVYVCANANVHTFIGAVRSYATLRKLSFVNAGVEVYVYVYSGDANEWPALAAGGIASGYLAIRFSFRACKTQVYKASDDSVLWGG
jgi:hypothetical protein